MCAMTLCAFALLPASPAAAATRIVSNCNDSGTGSLRNVVANAASGDTIDLTALTCSRIVLTSGAIEVAQDDLELVGRNPWSLTIDGNKADRVFAHSGTGTLHVRRVSLANGHAIGVTGGWITGGCVRSLGSVELVGSWVHHCKAMMSGGSEPEASGGGIWAENRVLLSYSNAYANSAEADASATGGAVAGSEVVLYRSRVYGNYARWDGGGVGGGSVTATLSTIHNNRALFGGGIYVSCIGRLACTFRLDKSTVSANRAGVKGGFDAERAETAMIVDSTVSGNIARSHSAGYLPYEARIFNSTIAFNQEIGQCLGPLYTSDQLHLVSSIVSRNTCTTGADVDISGTVASRVTGRDNIIGNSELPIPPDTISAAPRLAPLADNGGPTRTHMSHADSPALDRGSNPLDVRYDQRGSGFPRVKGGLPDIGAVER